MAYDLTNQTYSPLGRLLMSGLIATGLIGGGFAISEFNSAGAPSPTEFTVIGEPLNAFLTATGSATVHYPALCVANPLRALGLGSGTVIRLSYQAGNNPTGVGADVRLGKSCADTGSGISLIENTCAGTGCVSHYTTGTAAWNGVDYLIVTLSGNPTSSYTGRVRLQYEDIFGE